MAGMFGTGTAPSIPIIPISMYDTCRSLMDLNVKRYR